MWLVQESESFFSIHEVKTFRRSNQHPAPAALTKESNPGTHLVEVWVGPQKGSGSFGKEKISCSLKYNELICSVSSVVE
jgi:hypothetical protein